MKEKRMLFQDIDFRDYAASRIGKTLLSVFFNQRITVISQVSMDRIVSSAYSFADRLEEKKTDNDLLNYMAVAVVEGMLFGFYENRPENKGWTSFIHSKKTSLFVQDAYRIAENMVAHSSERRSVDRNQILDPPDVSPSA
jgi:hypothetical protein